MLSRRPPRGFTLIEALIVLGVAATLATVTWPSFAGALLKARRAEALVALAQWQLAQERWRGEHPAYADGVQLGLPATIASGRYRLAVVSADEAGYVLRAVAAGAQAADAPCQQLELAIDAATVLRRSSADGVRPNDDAANRRCWGG